MASDDPRRVRALLDAVIGVGEGLELTEVLQRIVSTACELTGARHGALGVQDAAGAVVELYSHGVAQADRDRLGGRPHGLGVPGLLLADDATPLRLSNLATHPGSVGFPEHHPRMRAFVGVPIRVSGATFGNLYVADPPAGDSGTEAFTQEHEEALLALASAAGVAIGNARLYEAAHRRQTWWAAASEAAHTIVNPLAADVAEALAEVARIAGTAAAADLATVYLRTGDDLTLTAQWGPLAGSPLHGEAQVLLPLSVGRKDVGAIGLAWQGGRPPDPEHVPLMRAFAERVALALEASRAAADRAALAVLRDRDRIARDLHDLVIQRLFAVGLSLQAAGNVADAPEVAQRLARAVDDLDDTIKDVRRTIFQLHGTAVRSPLRDELEALVGAARADLGIAVRLVVEGPILGVPQEQDCDVLAVVREAVSNVAKHACAEGVDVVLRVGRALELEISDDGVGMEPAGRRSGLANLEDRATALGGSFRVRSVPGSGTTLTWSVPRR